MTVFDTDTRLIWVYNCNNHHMQIRVSFKTGLLKNQTDFGGPIENIWEQGSTLSGSEHLIVLVYVSALTRKQKV